MIKPQRIIVDVDGITCDTLPHWLKTLNMRHKLAAHIDGMKVWELHLNPPLDSIDRSEVYAPLTEKGFFLECPPIEGAQEFLLKLHNDGHQVLFVTARHGKIPLPETCEWFEMYFPWVESKQLIFCYDKDLIPADIIIDDKASTLVQYQKVHPQALCMAIKYHYNKGVKGVALFDKEPKAWEKMYQTITLYSKTLGEP